MTKEAKVVEPTYGFYSKVLNKPFDTLEELKNAEAEVKKAQEEKDAKALAKKKEANKVEDAFKELNAARKNYNEKVSAAKKVYLEEVAKANEKYNAIIKDESKVLEESEDKYNEALNEFNRAHPEGFHITLRDGDNVKTISRIGNFDFFDDFFDSFFKRF